MKEFFKGALNLVIIIFLTGVLAGFYFANKWCEYGFEQVDMARQIVDYYREKEHMPTASYDEIMERLRNTK